MIVKMKKYTFLVYHKQYLEFLERIKEIGVLHIIEKSEGIAENDELREKMQTASRVKTTLKQLKLFQPKGAVLAAVDATLDGVEALEQVEKILNEKDSLSVKLNQTEKERDRMEVWGNFSHQRIEELRESGFILSFFATQLRKFDQEWEILYNAFEIDRLGSIIYFATVTRPGEKIEIDADYITLSDKTADGLDVEIKNIRKAIEKNKADLEQVSVSHYNTLKEAQIEIMTDITFDRVILNTSCEADNKVMLLEGWCPEGSEGALDAYLEKSDVYFETSEPTETEKVPIKLKNNKFARLFEFIGELYDLPNYFEKDLTAYFAPFYVIFFGLCLGDAGYGLLILTLGLVMRKRLKEPAIRSVMSLLTVLGGGAIIMGIISGTFFGIGLIDLGFEWLNPFKEIMLDSNQLFSNALIFGVIQIVFGIFVKFTGEVSRKGFFNSLATLGWLILIVGGGGSAVLSTFGVISSEVSKWALIASCSIGCLFVFILNNIKRNPLFNIGAGIWDTYNMTTGLMGDVLSYIRLFALGLSGGVMGTVFNSLALSFGSGIDIPVARELVVLVILLLGHGINIFMAVLGSLVHPIRLTFVEFYKNSGFEGGGKKYRPFADYKEEIKIL